MKKSKKTITLLLFLIIYLFAITDSIAQVIPLGLYVDIDGKVKFWESEANRHGSIDDTVYVSVNGEVHLTDLRNLNYDYLTLIEPLKWRETAPNNFDPSRIYDTSYHYSSNKNWNITTFLNPVKFYDSSYSFVENYITCYYQNNPFIFKFDTNFSNKNNRPFQDESRGYGLTDSILKLVKFKLDNHIGRNYGKPYSTIENELDKLKEELSSPNAIKDSVKGNDYSVDLIMNYDYDQMDRLTRVVSYYHSEGVEVDSLKYDRKGNLIYFSRETIGIKRAEYLFKYNKSGQVKSISMNMKWFGDYFKFLDKIRFTYSRKGVVNSKSVWQANGWLTHYFEFKK